MLKYALKRLVMLIPILLGVSVIAFLLVRAMPGDAATSYLMAANIPPTKEAVAAATIKLGLDKPIIEQYGIWLWGILHLDFGYSYANNKPVNLELFGALANTMQLALTALLWTLLISAPLGIMAALRPGGKIDHFGRIFAFIGASMPSFWLGFLLMELFSIKLGALPVSGMGDWKHLILPSFTLAVLYIATYSRLLRNSLLENMDRRFVLYSRARGVDEKQVIGTHVLRNSLIPVVTSLGVNFAHMLAGTVIVESIFSWPGVGRLIIASITGRDFPMIQGYIVIMTVVFVVANLLADLACAALDPRIRIDG